MTCEQVRKYFEGLSQMDLETMALNAIVGLARATNRQEAEKAVVTFAPFLGLKHVFARVTPSIQQKMRDTLDEAEQQFGSLAKAAGMEGTTKGYLSDELV